MQPPFKGSLLRKGLSQDEVDLRLMKLGVRLKVLLHSTPLDSLFMVEVSRIESFIDVGNAVVIWLPPRLMYGLIYGLRGSYVTHHVRCNCHMAKTITLLIDALVCNTDTRPRPRRASLLCWMRRFSPSRCLKLC